MENVIAMNSFHELSADEMFSVDGGTWAQFWGTVAGVATIIVGVSMLVAPEPTMATKVGGYATIVAGVATIGWAWS